MKEIPDFIDKYRFIFWSFWKVYILFWKETKFLLQHLHSYSQSYNLEWIR